MHNRVTFYGLGKNYTGYGTATRNFAKAFNISNIKTKFLFDKNASNIIKDLNLKSYNGKCNIDFYFGPPPYKNLKNYNYNISYFYWEASHLPMVWAKGIKKLDEIWVPCELVRKACIMAGFNKIIRVIPTPHDKQDSNVTLDFPSPFSSGHYVDDDVFKFYSIFQWHYRKGPDILLKSYWKAFGRRDKAMLLLKVNALNYNGYTNSNIKRDIASIKSKLNLKYYAPIYVMDSIEPDSSIVALHKQADCYVSPHRGEGWGLPIHDAIYHKNPVIVTRYGGITGHLNKSSAGIIRHKVVPVKNMEWSPYLYNRTQRWAEPSVDSLSFLMKDAYSNFELYKEKSNIAKNIINEFSIDKISKIIERYICEIRL